MKKGIYHSSLPANWSWPDKLAFASQAGFDGVEIATTPEPNICQAIKQSADDLGIAIPSVMDSLHWKCPQSSPDPHIRQQGLDNLRQSLETASLVGANTVLLVPGVVTPDVSYQAAYQQSLESMEQVKELAEEYRICIGLENVWNKFLLSPLEFANFIDQIDSPYVGAYFDVGNVILYGYPEHWIEVLGSRIKKIHAKNFLRKTYTFTHLLYGDVDWGRVMTALRAIDYDDFVTAELPNYQTCPEQMVLDTAIHLDEIFQL